METRRQFARRMADAYSCRVVRRSEIAKGLPRIGIVDHLRGKAGRIIKCDPACGVEECVGWRTGQGRRIKGWKPGRR